MEVKWKKGRHKYQGGSQCIDKTDSEFIYVGVAQCVSFYHGLISLERITQIIQAQCIVSNE